MYKVIFACVHNAGRSQMASAFFNRFADRQKADERPMKQPRRESRLFAGYIERVQHEANSGSVVTTFNCYEKWYRWRSTIPLAMGENLNARAMLRTMGNGPRPRV